MTLRILLGLSLVLAANSAQAQLVFINELHYDNVGTDLGERVEVAGPAGSDLSGWSIVLYNGSGGASYATLPLGGNIPDQCDGFGTVVVDAPGIQNGSPDGLALVDAAQQVVQFLSYEGVFVATNGPANGMTSVDIGVSQPSNTPIGLSLGLTGTGTVYADFAWQEPSADSFGACNPGQTFVGGVDVPPTVLLTVPADQDSDVDANAVLTVQFSEAVVLEPDWFSLQCSVSGALSGATSGSGANYSLTPATPFAADEQCTWQILAAAVSDLGGLGMKLDETVAFTIAPDQPPTVLSTVPADGASGVAPNANIVIEFSEPVTVAAGWFAIDCSISGSVQASQSGSGSQYTLSPNAPFAELETCTVELSAALVTDLDGPQDPMLEDYEFEFTTRAGLSDYYQSADPSSAATLRATLHEIIHDHTCFPYFGAGTNTWTILELADEDPLNSSRILDVYRNSTHTKVGMGNSNYNREHTWPNSRGFPNNSHGDGTPVCPYTDTHMLYLSDPGHNTARGNKPYGTCSSSCTELTTQAYNGVGGGSGSYPGNSNWTNGSVFEVWHARRGDMARAMFYMDIRYEGGVHGVTSKPEPELRLTDDVKKLSTSKGGIAYMGLLSVLRDWHAADPPDELERLRNDSVFSFQGNRNPFIDVPEWVECIYGDVCEQGNDPIFENGFE